MAAGLCLITTSLCAILNCSWTALGSFPRPGEEAETVQQQGHPRFLIVLSLHARCKLQPLQPAALQREYVELHRYHTEGVVLWKLVRQTVQHLLAQHQLQLSFRLGLFCCPTGTSVCACVCVCGGRQGCRAGRCERDLKLCMGCTYQSRARILTELRAVTSQ